MMMMMIRWHTLNKVFLLLPLLLSVGCVCVCCWAKSGALPKDLYWSTIAPGGQANTGKRVKWYK